MPQIRRYIPSASPTSDAGAVPKSVWPVSHQYDTQKAP